MSWNSDIPLVFAHVILTKTLGLRRAWEIQAWITRCMDLWERGLHADMVGDAEAEGATQEGRDASRGKEEDKALARRYHNTVLSGKIWQDIRQATDREGEGCLLPDDQ